MCVQSSLLGQIQSVSVRFGKLQDRYTWTVPEQTKDNTITHGLWDVTWHFRDCLGRWYYSNLLTYRIYQVLHVYVTLHSVTFYVICANLLYSF